MVGEGEAGRMGGRISGDLVVGKGCDEVCI